MDETVSHFSIELEQVDGYEFRVRFDQASMAPLTVDESPPLGHDRGPSPTRMLAAAIGNCLAASLTFCMQRKKVKLVRVRSKVTVEIVRNEAKRLRVGQVRVELHPGIAGGPELDECIRSFEDFCTVTESVRAGLDVRVSVVADPAGAE